MRTARMARQFGAGLMEQHNRSKQSDATTSPGLEAAEVILLDSQLPDIGGAVRSKPIAPDLAPLLRRSLRIRGYRIAFARPAGTGP